MEDVAVPDVTHLVTEDDTPRDGFFQSRQMISLSDALHASWPEGRPFISASRVGIFATANEPPVVPDFLLSVGVEYAPNVMEKAQRSYFLWNFGKPPDVVVEVVSNRQGEEDTRKLERYARTRVPYYVIFDPEQHLSSRVLRVFQLTGLTYVDKLDGWLPELGLGLRVWEGVYHDMAGLWLRWCQQDGTLLATGAERAEEATTRADEATTRAQRLEERLRALGIDPNAD